MAETTAYGGRLQAALTRAGVSKRSLAKQLAEARGTQVESERSAIYGYLDGVEPEADRAALIAEILDDPSLAGVSGRAARRTRRLEELAKSLAELHQGQQEMLALQAETLDSLQSLREESRATQQDAPKQPRTKRPPAT